MNKKEAIAYAQVTLDYMQSSKYDGKLTPETLGIEMKQCFKLYTHNIILGIAEVVGIAFLSSSYKDAIAFGILILILIIKPTGIFGKTMKEKV